MMVGGMKQVIVTSKDEARLTPEQLADAGIEPRDRAVIEIRPYSEEDWIAETEGKVLLQNLLVLANLGALLSMGAVQFDEDPPLPDGLQPSLHGHKRFQNP